MQSAAGSPTVRGMSGAWQSIFDRLRLPLIGRRQVVSSLNPPMFQRRAGVVLQAFPLLIGPLDEDLDPPQLSNPRLVLTSSNMNQQCYGISLDEG